MLRRVFWSRCVLAAIVWNLVGSTPALADDRVDDRVTVDKKGSLLLFSNVEIKYDASGTQVLQDTILEITNDYPETVSVQMYLLNGDRQIDEECSGNPCVNIIQPFEPGWNKSDCRFALTANEPWLWSAAGDVCSFEALDMRGPGRLDPETDDDTRVLRGSVVLFAVDFFPEIGDTGRWEEIRWNHLTGTGTIVHYVDQTAWSYKPWAFQVVKEGVNHGDIVGTSGTLSLDGSEYEAPYGRLLLDFVASNSQYPGQGAIISLDTDLTIHPVSLDLRQENDGPMATKVLTEIWNESEVKFSETRRCICCWDQVLLSEFSQNDGVPNHFLRSKLGTARGKARLDGVASNDCIGMDICAPFEIVPGDTQRACGADSRCAPDQRCDRFGRCLGRRETLTRDTAILGVAVKLLYFDGAQTPTATAGSNLVGMDSESAAILYDLSIGPGELIHGTRFDQIGGATKPVTKAGSDRSRG